MVRVIFFVVLSHMISNCLADDISAISRGGLLYDRWYEAVGAEKPDFTHPAWPTSNKNKTGATTHRCKSCHGWDYMGREGSYASGIYKTGFPGIQRFSGKSKNEVLEILTNDLHNMGSRLAEKDLDNLAIFVVKGQFDFTNLIDVETNLVKSGDSKSGSEYYNTVCAKCHGFEGDLIEDMTPIGVIAHRNPWEVMHKIINGQPGEKMPSMRAFGMDVIMDIMAYVQTLKNN
jgi:thiosulfate dehydrogenase